VWHVHPHCTGERAYASNADQRAWSSWYRAGTERPFIGVIASPGDSDQMRSWTHPKLSAFVPDGGGWKYVPVDV
jgi:hypothetical protein